MMSTNAKYNPSQRCYCLPVGILLLVLGVSVLISGPYLVDFIRVSATTLRPDTSVYHMWQRNEVPNYLEVYLLNWTNPQDVYNASTKPHFQQVGPFRFQEFKEKIDVTWHEENNTVSYRQVKRWYFDEKTSCCDLSVNVTTINTVFVAMVSKSRDWNFMAKRFLDIALSTSSQKLHITRNASQLLFEGYPDPILAMGKQFPFLSTLPPVDRFGLYYAKNGSSKPDGLLNIGLDGDSYGQLLRWNSEPQTRFNREPCNAVQGSAGELYGARHDPNEQIRVFSTDMCRHVPLDYERDVWVHGIKGYKYSAGASMLDNGTLYAENACLCNGECLPSGTLNVSACRHGSPSFVSLPHFYQADPIYTEAVKGFAPEKDRHEFFVVIEPTTGLVLEVAIRIQMNVLVRPVGAVSIMEDIPSTFVFPVSWFEQRISMPETAANQVKLLFKLPSILQISSIVLIVLGALLAFLALCRPVWFKFQTNYRSNQTTSYVFRGEDVPLKAKNKE